MGRAHSGMDSLVTLIRWLLCCCDKYHYQKRLGEERIYFPIYLQAIETIKWGKSGKNSSENWSRNHREGLPTGCFPALLLRYLSSIVQAHLSGDDVMRSMFGLPTSAVNQESLFQTWVTGQCDPRNSFPEDPSFRVTLGCMKLAIKKSSQYNEAGPKTSSGQFLAKKTGDIRVVLFSEFATGCRQKL